MSAVLAPISLWIPIIVLGLVAWWIYNHRQQATNAARKLAALVPKKPATHAAPVVVIHTIDAHHAGAASHGHDTHHGGHAAQPKGPLWKSVLGWTVTVGVILLLLMAAGIPDLPSLLGFNENSRPMGAERPAASASIEPAGTTPVRGIPTDAISCPMDGTKTVIQPGKTIHVTIPDYTSINFKPDSKDGTIKACDYFRPDVCSSTDSTLEGDIDVLSVTNITSGESAQPVDFTCGYTTP